MKVLRIFYGLISSMMLIWVSIITCTLIFGYNKFGHIPVYGYDPDLSALGMQTLIRYSGFAMIFAFGTIPLWVCMTIYIRWWTKEDFSSFRFSRISFIVGLTLFLVLRVLMFDQFAWFID